MKKKSFTKLDSSGRKRAHGLNTISATALEQKGSKFEYSMDAACSKSAFPWLSVGTSGVPWLGYLSSM
jgi:hypothetical protein